jgi:ferredoxin-type protein NapH
MYFKTNRRYLIQWLLLPIVVIVIGLGWKYAWLGFVVPVVMLVGIIGAFFNGRYVCGNLCPRGAFFDRLITPISPQRKIRSFLRNMVFRWSVLILLMGFMIYRLSQNLGSWEHWGHVFWLMCTATTVLGIVLALFIRARTWCAFCPIGTFGKVIGVQKISLKLNAEKCIACNLCSKVCPMGLSVVSKNKELTVNSDCIKCLECVSRCPRQALFPVSR